MNPVQKEQIIESGKKYKTTQQNKSVVLPFVNSEYNEFGIISAIQRFSTGDGPGIRTTVFFQGCNLSCKWCHNPETIPPGGSVLFYENLCQNCGLCEKTCPNHLPRGYISYDKCTLCGGCAGTCAHGARVHSGKKMHSNEVFDIISEDVPFYEKSNGGVTFSGGEPLLQPGFVLNLAKHCKNEGLNLIIDTAGCVRYPVFRALKPYVDTYYFDLKGPDAEFYKTYIGGDFKLILSNLKKLLANGADVVVRYPLIPGINDSTEILSDINKLLVSMGVKKLHLLPYHRFGQTKYKAMGLQYELSHLPLQTSEQLNSALAIFSPSLCPEISG